MKRNVQGLSGREYFDRVSKWKSWYDPNNSSSPQRFTIHRQKQLASILEVYGGAKIPFTHFKKEFIRNPAKRNKYVFPVVFAYICGILKIEGNYLIKPKGLILGERHFSRKEAHWV